MTIRRLSVFGAVVMLGLASSPGLAQPDGTGFGSYVPSGQDGPPDPDGFAVGERESAFRLAEQISNGAPTIRQDANGVQTPSGLQLSDLDPEEAERLIEAEVARIQQLIAESGASPRAVALALNIASTQTQRLGDPAIIQAVAAAAARTLVVVNAAIAASPGTATGSTGAPTGNTPGNNQTASSGPPPSSGGGGGGGSDYRA